MLTKFLFRFVLYPLSILPFFLLYGLSYFIYLIIYYVVRYRRKVTFLNLRHSFPEKSEHEIRIIARQYYLHLSQIAVEMLKMLTLSHQSLKKRYVCQNPEVVNRYFSEGRSVILMSSHYNNWEWMVLSLDSQFKHHGVGVGKANSNKTFEKLINRARTRYGTEVVFADTVRETFEQYESQHIPVVYMMLSDQSPNSPKKCYMTTFLHQRSGMIYGSEYFARKYNIPVLYYEVIKEKPGYYHINIKHITDTPQELPEGAIIDKYVELLEETIRLKPQYWLWSHRRWKHKFDNQ